MEFKAIKSITSLLVIFSLAGCQKDPDTIQTQASPPPVQQVVTPKKPLTYEGPFGLKMGLSIEETKSLISGISKSEESEWIYHADTVPIPHSDFESYSLRFSQTNGLCKISAIGKDIKSGDSGSEIKSVFNSLDESLSKKYGKGKKYDFTSSKYESPEYWMMYLLKKNRTLTKFWMKEYGSTLSNNLSAIQLNANAIDMSTGYLILNYEFENFSDCVDEAKSEKSKAL